jgi:hypothetical protein
MRHRSRVRMGLKGLNTSRLLFLNGQIAKGNLKPRRRRTKTETFRRLADRMALIEVILEHRARESESK